MSIVNQPKVYVGNIWLTLQLLVTKCYHTITCKVVHKVERGGVDGNRPHHTNLIKGGGGKEFFHTKIGSFGLIC